LILSLESRVHITICLLLLATAPLAARSYTSPDVQCKQRLTELSLCLEMYSTDTDGEYPENLELLIPDYLPLLEQHSVCPSSSQPYEYQVSQKDGVSSFRLVCLGRAHWTNGERRDFVYDSHEGFLNDHLGPQLEPAVQKELDQLIEKRRKSKFWREWGDTIVVAGSLLVVLGLILAVRVFKGAKEKKA
jgi:hypothetical protein